MKVLPIATIFIIFFLTNIITAQNIFNVNVKDNSTQESLVGANVFFADLNLGSATDEKGFAKINNIPNGNHLLTVSYLGYQTKKLELKFPTDNNQKTFTVLLKPEDIKSHEVLITSTRTNGVVENSPIKVEILGQEEVNEEVAIRPGNVSKLLGETSGVIVQQTSSISGVVSFRLEGLPGGYTQLLKDGLPILNQFSSGFTLLQIPPLDLQQIEVVKGATSLFYGNGAVAGFVNIVTKKPKAKPEFDLVLNQTSQMGRDISTFYSNKFGKLGISLLASQSSQQPVDVDGDGFTDIPKFRQTTINPRLFWDFNNTTSLIIGVNSFFEDRSGGDISAIKLGIDSLHSYIEDNKSDRFNTEINFSKIFVNNSKLTFRNNFYFYNRDIIITDNFFSGRQLYSFNELSFLMDNGDHKTVIGANFVADNFKDKGNANNSYSYNRSTIGVFVQDEWQIDSRFLLQPGLRIDYNNEFNFSVLPHLSLLYKLTTDTQLRLTGSSGYRIPDIFNVTDQRDFVKHNIYLSPNIKKENANSLNFDFSYKLVIDEFVLKLNQAFFYTDVKNAVIPNYYTSGNSPIIIDNSNSSIKTMGFDTNLLIAIEDLELFVDYSYADVQKTENGITSPLELTPKNKINLALIFEEEDEVTGEEEWRIGLEAFYTGEQYLPDATYSRSYWFLGAMVEKIFDNFSIILNIENILDERQTKYENIVLPPNNDPSFSPIYMPIDGRVANIALWIKL